MLPHIQPKQHKITIDTDALYFWGPIYKISYDLSQDYLTFIVKSTYDGDLQRAKISVRNIAG